MFHKIKVDLRLNALWTMNTFFTLCVIGSVLASIAYAQPANYYNNANGLTDYQLKTALSTIITLGHNDRGYNALYNGYFSTDSDNFYENDGSVLDMYSEKPLGPDSYFYTHGNRTCGQYNSENDCYNREHLMPQSVFASATPMRSDIHFVVPADGYVNGIRGSLPFGEVNSPNHTTTNGSKRGNNVSNFYYTGVVFEPIDEFKGDIARCLLYFATRYENQISSWNYTGVFDGSSNKVYTDWFLNLLLKWHLQDSVSAREIARNNAAYTFQGNRNPFIDSMHYAIKIWGMPDTVKPTIPLNLVASDTTTTTVKLSWNFASDNIGVKEYYIYQGGIGITNTNNDSIVLTGLSPNTTYSYCIKAIDSIGNESGYSDTVTITTKPSPIGITEKFISPIVNTYPNPFNNTFTVKSNTPLWITIYDLTGVIIYKGANYQSIQAISLLNQKNGVYILEGYNQNNILLRKRIVKL